jgi:hypothetical protein
MKKVKHIMEDVDLSISHEKQGLPIITEMLKVFKPELIIELGTGNGGFTYVLHKAVECAELHTFDKKEGKSIKRNLYNKNVYFHGKCDILSVCNVELVELCKSPKKKLLYCDNGRKVQEVKMYSKYLNVGDLLGMHDWPKEISYDDVADELKCFSPHEINVLMEENKRSSRFWIKGEQI